MDELMEERGFADMSVANETFSQYSRQIIKRVLIEEADQITKEL